jgi:hypothetical protein
MPRIVLKENALPKLSAEIWAQLYAAADAVFALKPWERIPPDILLKISHPVTNEPVYGSILGAMGEVFGISIQFGKWAEYSLMRAFAEDEEDALLRNVHRITSFKIEFVKKSELSAADKQSLKGLAYKPQPWAKGACWPSIEVMKEGSVPCPPDPGDAEVILDIVHCFTAMVQAMARHADGNPDTLPEGIAVWPEGRTAGHPVKWDEIEWRPFEVVPEPACEEFQLDEFTVAQLRHLPQVNEQLELDAFGVLASVKQGPRPFYVKLGFAVDSKRGILLGFEPGASGTDSLENIVGRLLVEVVSKLKARPKRVLFSQTSLLQAMERVARNLEIEVLYQKRLPAMEEALASLPENFGL